MEPIRIGELTGVEVNPTERRYEHPVLFVHGWWGGAWVWDRFMGRFAQRGHSCCAIDLRGYHGSKPVADMGKVRFDEHLEDLREAVDALRDPVLVTHSASGLLALKLAEEGRRLPAAVHLVPVPPAGYFSARTLRVFVRHLPRLFRDEPVLLDRDEMFDADLNRLPPEEQEEVYARMVPAPGREGRDQLGTRVDPRKVGGPRLIVSGSDDRLIPASIHAAMARQFGAEYHEYPNHAHYLMREPGWERVADDVARWVEERAFG